MRRYVLHVCLVALAVFLPIVSFSWWVEPLHGDLTRIGKWPERDFGPRAPTAPIEVGQSGPDGRHASILVLGDSFAQRNLWQSVLHKRTGLSVQSFDMDRNCLGNWLEAALAEPHSKVIILESVERGLIARFAKAQDCRGKKIIPLEVSAGPKSDERRSWPLTLDAVYLGHTAFNLAFSALTGEERSGRFRTVNVSLRSDCARFSSRRNDRLLYYAEDDLKSGWSKAEIDASVSRILEIQQQVERAGKRFVFILAPDKSTVYRSCVRGAPPDARVPRINERLISAGVLAPDMTAVFESRIHAVVDLYNPDDTHWSHAGYVLAGETVARFLGGGNAAH